MRAWPVEELKQAEQRVMATVPDGSLMQRAAHAIAQAAVEYIGFGYGAQVLLLVGAGDNGGDALYAGARLARRGMGVRAVLAGGGRVHAAGLAAFRSAGGRVVPAEDVGAAPCDLIVDGLLGIGARGPLRDSLAGLVRAANAASAPILAVDVPSGVDPDTGEVAGAAIRAHLTVCPGTAKIGLLVGAGRIHAGRVVLVPLGLEAELPPPPVAELDDQTVGDLLTVPGPDDDKYTRGVVGVVAGSARYPGAAQLAVGAARLGGVGAVRYAGHAAAAVSTRYPDVLVSETVSGAGRVQAWTVGPGLGDAEQAGAELEVVLASDVPVLVDADGLNLLAGRVERIASRTAPTVLTPHDREFARLFGDVFADRVGSARRAAAESGAVVLLKGYATVIAAPDGRVLVNPTGSPALSTAGSGDVLSGLIGSLLATGVDPFLAAAAGAYLHGLAAHRAAELGPVTAPDLLDALPGVFADLS
ncbi:MAG: YjeF protein [Frankiales bacterium]|nr:YjeF protein [Frankiales bacterium]